MKQISIHPSIEFSNWLIVGLDTAFFDDSPLFFRGKICDPTQKAFLRDIRRQADEKGQMVFLLTHHLPMNLPGTELSVVWDEHVIFTENDVTERYINQKGEVEFEI